MALATALIFIGIFVGVGVIIADFKLWHWEVQPMDKCEYFETGQITCTFKGGCVLQRGYSNAIGTLADGKECAKVSEPVSGFTNFNGTELSMVPTDWAPYPIPVE